ncbi:MAG: hypothetical protein KF850_17730 [Labilithrix sp.]|nr:hypothetical protein [Labilithrix sp.]MBX3213884.1 hypothetical protein [Labilithrix sp.]
MSLLLLQAPLAAVAAADDRDRGSTLCDEARVLAAEGKTEESVARYREHLESARSDEPARLAMAMTLSWSKERRHLEEAVVLLSEYVERNPADGVGLLQRARVRSWIGQVPLAVSDFRAYLAAHPDDHAAELELATALASRRESQAEAIAIYDAHLARSPDDLSLRLKRARVRSWAGDVAAARADYRAYLRADAAADGVELELARALSWSKDVAHRREAVPLFERSLARRRDDLGLTLALAQTLGSLPGRASLVRALEVCDRYLARHPEALAVLRLRGRVRAWAGRADAAAEDLRAYARAVPRDQGAALELADVVAGGSEPAAAVPLYDAYLARRPDDALARTRRARARLWAGDFAAAEKELDVLRVRARTDEVKSAVDLELARLYAQTERREAALDLVEAALVRAPKDRAMEAERSRLVAVLGPRVQPRFFFYADEARYVVAASTLEGSVPVARRVSLVADVGAWSLGSSLETLRAGRANAGALLRAGALELEAAGGPRVYEHFEPAFGARASVRVQARPVKAGVEYQFDDLYIDSFQPASIAAGIRGHAVHVGADAELPIRVRVTGRVGSRILLSDNRSFDAVGRVFVRVVGPLSVGYDGTYLTWRYYDPSYWSPQAFAAHLGAVKVAQTFSRGKVGYEVQALTGVAGERIARAPEAGFGLSYGGSAALVYSPAPRFVLRVATQYSNTIREIPRSVGGALVQAPEGGAPRASSPASYWWATTTASVTVFL